MVEVCDRYEGKIRNACRFLVRKSKGKRPLGRSRRRLRNNIEI